jgi:hypothetical protein
LEARFTMVKPDGMTMHTHDIYNFNSTEITEEANSTNVVKGNAIVTMEVVSPS